MNEDDIIMLCVEYFLLSLGFHNVKRMSSDAASISHSHSVTDNRQFGR